MLKKILPEGMSFPFDFGFIPSTLGDDGDPLDVLVLMDEPVGTGVVVPARLIGVIDAMQTEKDGETVENARLIAVSAASLLLTDVRRLSALPPAALAQIEHFFVSYNEQEGRVFAPTGRHGPRKAMQHVEAGRRRYRRRKRIAGARFVLRVPPARFHHLAGGNPYGLPIAARPLSRTPSRSL